MSELKHGIGRGIAGVAALTGFVLCGKFSLDVLTESTVAPNCHAPFVECIDTPIGEMSLPLAGKLGELASAGLLTLVSTMAAFQEPVK